jgi:hypothetical protein
MGQAGPRSVGVTRSCDIGLLSNSIALGFTRIVAPEIPCFGQDSDRGD